MSQELFEALEQHDTRRLAELLSQGADPNEGRTSAADWPPLKSAVDQFDHGGTTEAVVLLLRYGANPNGSGAAGDSPPLLVAVMNRRLDAVQILLAAGANPNVRNDEGDSPLLLAIKQNDLAITSVLLACGAVKSIDDSGTLLTTTPLGLAAHNMNIELVELLLSYGANPDIPVAADFYSKAYERLPVKNEQNAQVWDTIMSLIGPG
jgi:ankyrin repeat protein